MSGQVSHEGTRTIQVAPACTASEPADGQNPENRVGGGAEQHRGRRDGAGGGGGAARPP